MEKMFGYMPYFGLQAGIIYGKEGYEFKANDESVKEEEPGSLRWLPEYFSYCRCSYLLYFLPSRALQLPRLFCGLDF